MPEYISPKETAVKWDVKVRQVTKYCELGRIPGVYKVGNNWIIPADAKKPADARIKSGKYIGVFAKRNKTKSRDKGGERE